MRDAANSEQIFNTANPLPALFSRPAQLPAHAYLPLRRDLPHGIKHAVEVAADSQL